MQAIKCELCGSGNIMKQDGFFICQNCKTKYSIEEARKLIGTVKIDKTDDVNNLFILARRYFNEQNYDESYKYFEMILRDAPNNWEAVFFHALCQLLNDKTLYPTTTISMFKKRMLTSLNLIKDNNEEHAVETLGNLTINTIPIIHNYAYQNKTISPVIFREITRELGKVYEDLEIQLKLLFPNHGNTIHSVQKALYNLIKQTPSAYKWSERRELTNRLKKSLGSLI